MDQLRRIGLFCLCLLLLTGCDATPRPGPASRAETERVRPEGRRLAHELQFRLRGELMAALEAGGPEGAVTVCAERAVQIGAEIGVADRTQAELKRVSRRARNQANAPDHWELLALDTFEAEDGRGRALPEDWVQRLERNGETVYRYYQPISVGAPCLACHGDPAAMSDTLRATLARLYPEDQATGYREGEFRGLLRVEIAARHLHK